MKKTLCAAIAFCLSLGLTGCSPFAIEHPEKSKKEFYEDQALCDKKARDYAMERRGKVDADDEREHSRRCMEDLGWNYSLRLFPTSSEKKSSSE